MAVSVDQCENSLIALELTKAPHKTNFKKIYVSVM